MFIYLNLQKLQQHSFFYMYTQIMIISKELQS